MYQSFAFIYDALMDPHYYQNWYDLIDSLNVNTIMDLGCGTGTFSIYQAQQGKLVYGVDLSKEMIQVANIKASNAQVVVNFQVADMLTCVIEAVDCVTCLCDTINYLPTQAAITQFFQHVYHQVQPGTYFIFDTHTMFKINTVFDDYHQLEEEQDYKLEWSVKKVSDHVIKHQLTFIDYIDPISVKEEHTQFVEHLSFYLKQAELTGFTLVTLLTDFKEYHEKGERHIVVLRK